MDTPPPNPRHIAMQALKVDSVTAEVIRAFYAKEIGCILMKGPLTQALYPTGEVRPYVDTDLLVEPSSWVAAQHVLSKLGFKQRRISVLPNLGGIPPHARTYMRADGSLVDLHRVLPHVRCDPDQCWNALADHRSMVALSGTKATALDAAAQAFQLAVHIVQHPGKQKYARDLTLATKHISIEDWRRAGILAQRLRAAEAFAVGLSLTEGGAAILGSTGLTPPDKYPRVSATGARGFRWVGNQLRGSTSLGDRLVFIGRIVVPHPKFMRRISPVAERSFAGLVLAYLLRPFVLLTRLGPALRNYFTHRGK